MLRGPKVPSLRPSNNRDMAPNTPLPGTSLLTDQGDLAARMVSGIDAYLARATAVSVEHRRTYWQRDTSSHQTYSASVESNRERLRVMIGANGPREAPNLVVESVAGARQWIAEGAGYRVYAVRWSALPGVDGEGLMLVPHGSPAADVVALPDCDWTPEMVAGISPGVPRHAQFARRLAEAGCRVIVPVLVDRRDTWSVLSPAKMTNQPHREMIWRAAYELGQTPIGIEVQKALAAVDWLAGNTPHTRPVAVAGYGEG